MITHQNGKHCLNPSPPDNALGVKNYLRSVFL